MAHSKFYGWMNLIYFVEELVEVLSGAKNIMKMSSKNLFNSASVNSTHLSAIRLILQSIFFAMNISENGGAGCVPIATPMFH